MNRNNFLDLNRKQAINIGMAKAVMRGRMTMINKVHAYKCIIKSEYTKLFKLLLTTLKHRLFP